MDVDFLNSNAFRAYPFRQDEPLLLYPAGSAASVALPTAAIVDFRAWLFADSLFVETYYDIYLHQLTRVGPNFIFDFRCAAPGLQRYALRFERHRDDLEYVSQFSAALLISGEDDAYCADRVRWEGVLTTGDMRVLDELLADGDVLTALSQTVRILPTLVENAAMTRVNAVTLANHRRTTALPPADCPQPADADEDEYLVHSRCLVGDLRCRDGYNVFLRQNNRDNSLTISAGVGNGAGTPCEEVPLTADETSPDGGQLLTGGPACNETIKSINGVSGSTIRLVAGQGVRIRQADTPHKLILDVDLHDLTTCELPFIESSLGPEICYSSYRSSYSFCSYSSSSSGEPVGAPVCYFGYTVVYVPVPCHPSVSSQSLCDYTSSERYSSCSSEYSSSERSSSSLSSSSVASSSSSLSASSIVMACSVHRGIVNALFGWQTTAAFGELSLAIHDCQLQPRPAKQPEIFHNVGDHGFAAVSFMAGSVGEHSNALMQGKRPVSFTYWFYGRQLQEDVALELVPIIYDDPDPRSWILPVTTLPTAAYGPFTAKLHYNADDPTENGWTSVTFSNTYPRTIATPPYTVYDQPYPVVTNPEGLRLGLNVYTRALFPAGAADSIDGEFHWLAGYVEICYDQDYEFHVEACDLYVEQLRYVHYVTRRDFVRWKRTTTAPTTLFPPQPPTVICQSGLRRRTFRRPCIPAEICYGSSSSYELSYSAAVDSYSSSSREINDSSSSLSSGWFLEFSSSDVSLDYALHRPYEAAYASGVGTMAPDLVSECVRPPHLGDRQAGFMSSSTFSYRWLFDNTETLSRTRPSHFVVRVLARQTGGPGKPVHVDLRVADVDGVVYQGPPSIAAWREFDPTTEWAWHTVVFPPPLPELGDMTRDDGAYLELAVAKAAADNVLLEIDAVYIETHYDEAWYSSRSSSSSAQLYPDEFPATVCAPHLALGARYFDVPYRRAVVDRVPLYTQQPYRVWRRYRYRTACGPRPEPPVRCYGSSASSWLVCHDEPSSSVASYRSSSYSVSLPSSSLSCGSEHPDAYIGRPDVLFATDPTFTTEGLADKILIPMQAYSGSAAALTAATFAATLRFTADLAEAESLAGKTVSQGQLLLLCRIVTTPLTLGERKFRYNITLTDPDGDLLPHGPISSYADGPIAEAPAGPQFAWLTLNWTLPRPFAALTLPYSIDINVDLARDISIDPTFSSAPLEVAAAYVALRTDDEAHYPALVCRQRNFLTDMTRRMRVSEPVYVSAGSRRVCYWRTAVVRFEIPCPSSVSLSSGSSSCELVESLSSSVSCSSSWHSSSQSYSSLGSSESVSIASSSVSSSSAAGYQRMTHLILRPQTYTPDGGAAVSAPELDDCVLSPELTPETGSIRGSDGYFVDSYDFPTDRLAGWRLQSGKLHILCRLAPASSSSLSSSAQQISDPVFVGFHFVDDSGPIYDPPPAPNWANWDELLIERGEWRWYEFDIPGLARDFDTFADVGTHLRVELRRWVLDGQDELPGRQDAVEVAAMYLELHPDERLHFYNYVCRVLAYEHWQVRRVVRPVQTGVHVDDWREQTCRVVRFTRRRPCPPPRTICYRSSSSSISGCFSESSLSQVDDGSSSSSIVSSLSLGESVSSSSYQLGDSYLHRPISGAGWYAMDYTRIDTQLTAPEIVIPPAVGRTEIGGLGLPGWSLQWLCGNLAPLSYTQPSLFRIWLLCRRERDVPEPITVGFWLVDSSGVRINNIEAATFTPGSCWRWHAFDIAGPDQPLYELDDEVFGRLQVTLVKPGGDDAVFELACLYVETFGIGGEPRLISYRGRRATCLDGHRRYVRGRVFVTKVTRVCEGRLVAYRLPRACEPPVSSLSLSLPSSSSSCSYDSSSWSLSSSSLVSSSSSFGSVSSSSASSFLVECSIHRPTVYAALNWTYDTPSPDAAILRDCHLQPDQPDLPGVHAAAGASGLLSLLWHMKRHDNTASNYPMQGKRPVSFTFWFYGKQTGSEPLELQLACTDSPPSAFAWGQPITNDGTRQPDTLQLGNSYGWSSVTFTDTYGRANPDAGNPGEPPFLYDQPYPTIQGSEFGIALGLYKRDYDFGGPAAGSRAQAYDIAAAYLEVCYDQPYEFLTWGCGKFETVTLHFRRWLERKPYVLWRSAAQRICSDA